MKYTFKENHIETTLDYGDLIISGDETKGFRPFQLLVSSVVSCSGAVFKDILAKQRIEITSLTATANVTRNPEAANRIEQIDIRFYVTGDDLDQTRLTKSLATARRHCSMVQSVKDSIQITETVAIV